MPAMADPYATVATEAAPVAGPVPSGEMLGAVPADQRPFHSQAGMVPHAPINPARGAEVGEVDKVSVILAVVSFLIVVGMVVVLAMMKVE